MKTLRWKLIKILIKDFIGKNVFDFYDKNKFQNILNENLNFETTVGDITSINEFMIFDVFFKENDDVVKCCAITIHCSLPDKTTVSSKGYIG
jgi:hypothetical protein